MMRLLFTAPLYLCAVAMMVAHAGHYTVTHYPQVLDNSGYPAIDQIRDHQLTKSVRSWIQATLPVDPESVPTVEIFDDDDEGDEGEGGVSDEARAKGPEIYWNPVATILCAISAGPVWSFASVLLLNPLVGRFAYLQLWASRLVVGSAAIVVVKIYMLVHSNPYHLQDDDPIPVFGTMYLYKAYQIMVTGWFAFTAIKSWEYSIRKEATRQLHYNWMIRHIVFGFATQLQRPFPFSIPFVLQHKGLVDFGISKTAVFFGDVAGLFGHAIFLATAEMYITSVRKVDMGAMAAAAAKKTE